MQTDNEVLDLAEIVKQMDIPLNSAEVASHPVDEGSLDQCPPSYDIATGVKRPTSEGDSEDTDSTIKKSSFSLDRESSDDDEEYEDAMCTVRDKDTLLHTIEILRTEQQELRKRQEQHDRHIKELLQREPYINRQFRSMRKSTQRELISSDLTEHDLSTEEHIYVQLEQLYANFQVLHFPNKTIQSILGRNRPFKSSSAQPETKSLQDENLSLRQKVEVLEDKLKKFQRTDKSMIPSPASSQQKFSSSTSTSSGGRSCETRSLQPKPWQTFVPGRPTSPLPLQPANNDICPEEVAFMWVISDYLKKFTVESQDGHRQTSSPFYLTHGGYRLQLEAYLNGNGTARNRCMSVFLRVIQGDYDRHLKWPVNLHLTVVLVNQSGDHRDSIKATGHQFQFSKPWGLADGEGDCWGLIEFVSHGMIKEKQYIYADSIKLKCRIQFCPREADVLLA